MLETEQLRQAMESERKMQVHNTNEQHNTTQHSTTQHNTAQHSTTQHNTTQHTVTQLCLLFCFVCRTLLPAIVVWGVVVSRMVRHACPWFVFDLPRPLQIR
jgi:hypothetical protein